MMVLGRVASELNSPCWFDHFARLAWVDRVDYILLETGLKKKIHKHSPSRQANPEPQPPPHCHPYLHSPPPLDLTSMTIATSTTTSSPVSPPPPGALPDPARAGLARGLWHRFRHRVDQFRAQWRQHILHGSTTPRHSEPRELVITFAPPRGVLNRQLAAFGRFVRGTRGRHRYSLAADMSFWLRRQSLTPGCPLLLLFILMRLTQDLCFAF